MNESKVLVDRIDQLERQNRRAKRAAVLLIVAGLNWMSLGQAPAKKAPVPS